MSKIATNVKMKAGRALKGMTQEDLGQRCNASRQTIALIEGGVHSPSVFLALRIAKALAMSVESLFGENEEAELQC